MQYRAALPIVFACIAKPLHVEAVNQHGPTIGRVLVPKRCILRRQVSLSQTGIPVPLPVTKQALLCKSGVSHDDSSDPSQLSQARPKYAKAAEACTWA